MDSVDKHSRDIRHPISDFDHSEYQVVVSIARFDCGFPKISIQLKVVVTGSPEGLDQMST